MTDYAAFVGNKAHLVGDDAGFSPTWLPDFLFDFQRALVEWSLRKGRAAIFADCGLGKGQPEGAQILTPGGFVSNTALRVGDLVVASDGGSYPLRAKYMRGVQPTFAVYYSDGAHIVVDAAHLHIVRTNNDRRRGKPWRVLSTDVLARSRLRYGTKQRSRTYDIPVVYPVQMPEVAHWIHPYVLGVLLGDGCISKSCTLTVADGQIRDTVRALLPVGWTLRAKPGSAYDYKLSRAGSNDRAFIAELRRLGLYGRRSGTKFIPREYLYDSTDNRLWLLRGLMDTDGFIADTSQFYSTSETLANDALTLVRSLGGVPTRTVKRTSCMHKGTRRTGAPCHVLTFSLNTFNPFHLDRKAKRWNPTPRDNGRWIDRIEPREPQPTVCLSVGSPDQSYVTEHFVVTHNTPIQLVWAENVVRHTNRAVLVLTPLAVSAQTLREAEKFGVWATRAAAGNAVAAAVYVTNYERLHHLDPDDYAGVVCDESSILKSFDGETRASITAFMRKTPYRLLCTATAAPNDYIELGTSSEALGYLGWMDMLNRFFKNARNNSSTGQAWGTSGGGGPQWRFRGHAEEPFWRWVCSWARSLRKPSDLGFDDSRFALPPLVEREHTVKALAAREGYLFSLPAVGLAEEREERRRTLKERCETAAALVADTRQPAVMWCHLNDEGDLLTNLVPGAVQVSGRDSDEDKEEKFRAFSEGETRVLVTKPVIGCFGLNWQHCAHMTSFASHSFEQYYQSVRRFWRFGQTRPVMVDHVTSDGEHRVLANLQRKAQQAERLFTEITKHVKEAMAIDHRRLFPLAAEVPPWL